MNYKALERGVEVIVRCWNGEKRKNVVWERGDRVVYVCSERQYSALRAGLDAPPPIGFLMKDIEPAM